MTPHTYPVCCALSDSTLHTFLAIGIAVGFCRCVRIPALSWSSRAQLGRHPRSFYIYVMTQAAQFLGARSRST